MSSISKLKRVRKVSRLWNSYFGMRHSDFMDPLFRHPNPRKEDLQQVITIPDAVPVYEGAPVPRPSTSMFVQQVGQSIADYQSALVEAVMHSKDLQMKDVVNSIQRFCLDPSEQNWRIAAGSMFGVCVAGSLYVAQFAVGEVARTMSYQIQDIPRLLAAQLPSAMDTTLITIQQRLMVPVGSGISDITAHGVFLVLLTSYILGIPPEQFLTRGSENIQQLIHFQVPEGTLAEMQTELTSLTRQIPETLLETATEALEGVHVRSIVSNTINAAKVFLSSEIPTRAGVSGMIEQIVPTTEQAVRAILPDPERLPMLRGFFSVSAEGDIPEWANKVIDMFAQSGPLQGTRMEVYNAAARRFNSFWETFHLTAQGSLTGLRMNLIEKAESAVDVATIGEAAFSDALRMVAMLQFVWIVVGVLTMAIVFGRIMWLSVMQKRTSYFGKKWSLKYKRSINCKRPRGFSQKQFCKAKKLKHRKP